LVLGGLIHQSAHRSMGEHQAVKLLFDEFGGLAAQDDLAASGLDQLAQDALSEFHAGRTTPFLPDEE
jgi:hypothetical protein